MSASTASFQPLMVNTNGIVELNGLSLNSPWVTNNFTTNFVFNPLRGNYQTITLTNNIYLSNTVAGYCGHYYLRLIQDTPGGWTVFYNPSLIKTNAPMTFTTNALTDSLLELFTKSGEGTNYIGIVRDNFK